MTTLKYIGTYQIPVFCVSAIVNDDFSGLSDEEEKTVKDFLDGFKDGFTADWFEHIEEPYFSPYDDIFGRSGVEVIDVNFYGIN